MQFQDSSKYQWLDRPFGMCPEERYIYWSFSKEWPSVIECSEN
jgi:hypothetical protein